MSFACSWFNILICHIFRGSFRMQNCKIEKDAEDFLAKSQESLAKFNQLKQLNRPGMMLNDIKININ